MFTFTCTTVPGPLHICGPYEPASSSPAHAGPLGGSRGHAPGEARGSGPGIMGRGIQV
jgi:hypothetical protein